MDASRFKSLKSYFEEDSRKFEHVRLEGTKRDTLASGFFGVAYIIRAKNSDGTEKRMFVVKYARGEERGLEELRTEVRIIKVGNITLPSSRNVCRLIHCRNYTEPPMSRNPLLIQVVCCNSTVFLMM
jgi:hypothetical protein